jgi:hypothetical protein
MLIKNMMEDLGEDNIDSAVPIPNVSPTSYLNLTFGFPS